MLLKIMLCMVVILALFAGTHDAVTTKNQISIIGYIIFYIGLIWWIFERVVVGFIFGGYTDGLTTRSYIANGIMFFGSYVIIAAR